MQESTASPKPSSRGRCQRPLDVILRAQLMPALQLAPVNNKPNESTVHHVGRRLSGAATCSASGGRKGRRTVGAWLAQPGCPCCHVRKVLSRAIALMPKSEGFGVSLETAIMQWCGREAWTACWPT